MAIIPQSIQAGTTLSITASISAYPAPEWSLTLILRGEKALDIESEPEGTSHLIHKSADATSEWSPGLYWYSLRANNGTDVHEVESGQLSVSVDLASAGDDYDGRAHAERVLEAIESVIEGRANRDQESYRINNRELRRTPIGDLLKLRDHYRLEARRIRNARRGRKTLGRQVLTRFGSGI